MNDIACLRCDHWLPRTLGVSAIALGRHVLVAPGVEASRPLLRHELAHVRQWRRHGILGFVARYLADYVAGRLRGLGHVAAYRAIRFEREARAAEGE